MLVVGKRVMLWYVDKLNKCCRNDKGLEFGFWLVLGGYDLVGVVVGVMIYGWCMMLLRLWVLLIVSLGICLLIIVWWVRFWWCGVYWIGLWLLRRIGWMRMIGCLDGDSSRYFWIFCVWLVCVWVDWLVLGCLCFVWLVF